MNANIKTREYTTVREVAGPLMIVEGVEGVAYNEIVDIETPNGEMRRGQVLEVKGDVAVVQVFEGTRDLNTATTKVRFTGETAKIGVSLDMLGRVFSGTGSPIDGDRFYVGIVVQGDRMPIDHDIITRGWRPVAGPRTAIPAVGLRPVTVLTRGAGGRLRR